MAFNPWRTWVALDPLTAAELNQDIRDNGNALFPQGVGSTTWTPVLSAETTNPTVSSATGHRIQVGGLQLVWARFVISSGGLGFYSASLPVATAGITASGAQGSGQAIGSWSMRDDSAANHASGVAILLSTTSVWFMAGEYFTNRVHHNIPFTVASGDVLSFFATYPVA